MVHFRLRSRMSLLYHINMPINQKLPCGLLRSFLRLPIFFFHLGLGFLFGRRFLMLTHVGRKSGRKHETIIEIARFDPQTGIYYVASGWGKKADWYRNILAHPDVIIQVKNQRLNVKACLLSIEQAGDELLRYSKTYPLAFRELMGVLGFKNIQTEEDVRSIGENLPIIAFEPFETASALQ
jgi:deazaflavin-dependent oxidoreductase (nitroreductase family)